MPHAYAYSVPAWICLLELCVTDDGCIHAIFDIVDIRLDLSIRILTHTYSNIFKRIKSPSWMLSELIWEYVRVSVSHCESLRQLRNRMCVKTFKRLTYRNPQRSIIQISAYFLPTSQKCSKLAWHATLRKSF